MRLRGEIRGFGCQLNSQKDRSIRRLVGYVRRILMEIRSMNESIHFWRRVDMPGLERLGCCHLSNGLAKHIKRKMVEQIWPSNLAAFQYNG